MSTYICCSFTSENGFPRFSRLSSDSSFFYSTPTNMSGSPEGIYEPGIVDPKTPRADYTSPYWHVSLHKHANFQSAWPNEVVDVVIIGSGISGMTLARTLTTKNSNLRVVLVDARQLLCWGYRTKWRTHKD
jgi:hypothetical protein